MDNSTAIRITYYADTLAMIPVKIVFNMTSGVVKVFSEGKYYIFGIKNITWMEYSSARNCWNIAINCPLPIGEKDA